MQEFRDQYRNIPKEEIIKELFELRTAMDKVKDICSVDSSRTNTRIGDLRSEISRYKDSLVVRLLYWMKLLK